MVAEASIEGAEQYLHEMYDEYVERWKCLIDGVEEFCAWCLSDFLYQDK